jgi:hypothetical protein
MLWRLPNITRLIHFKAIVSSHNFLGDGRYYDVDSSTSFTFDHATGKASDVRSHALESKNSDLMYCALI